VRQEFKVPIERELVFTDYTYSAIELPTLQYLS